MDLFSHALLPYLLGDFFKRKKEEITALVVGGIAPDFDFLLLWINSVYPNFFLTTHRGLTHSLFFGFFTAVVIMYLTARNKELIRRLVKFAPEIRFNKSTLAFMYIGVLTHLLLDYITTRGVPLFYPFDATRWSAELFFYTDTYLTIFSLAAIILLYKTKQDTHAAAARKILVTFLVVFLVLGGIRYAEKSDAQASYVNAEIFPTTDMFRWYALAGDDEIIRIYEYNGWNKTTSLRGEFKRRSIVFSDAAPPFEESLKLARKLPQVRMFEWRAHVTAINASFKNAWIIEFYNPVQRAGTSNAPASLRRAFGGFRSLAVKVENGSAAIVNEQP